MLPASDHAAPPSGALHLGRLVERRPMHLPGPELHVPALELAGASELRSFASATPGDE